MRGGRLVMLVAVLAVIALTVVIARSDSSGSQPERQVLKTEAGRIVDAGGDRVNLVGFNMIPIWDEPGRTWPQNHYDRIADAGMNTVRFVLHWDVMEPRQGEFNQQALQTLDTAIARANAASLYVVLDLIHIYRGESHVPGWARGGDAMQAIERHASGYVRALAERYRETPGVVAYDPVNEPPVAASEQNRVLRLYAGLIATIRRVDADTIIMFEPAHGDSSMAGADLRLLRDRRDLVFSMHDYYAGGASAGYTPDGEQDLDGGRYVWDGRTGYDAPAAGDLEDHLEVNLEIMRRAGIPVWIGEFGIGAGAPNAAAWIEDKVDVFQRAGVGYAWWLYQADDSMGAIDPGTSELRPLVRELAEGADAAPED